MKKNKKTILVGVDFTRSSENAIKYAAMLAEKNNFSLTVFHVFDVPIVNTYSGAFFISYPELEISNQIRLNRYVTKIASQHPKLEIHGMVTSGSVKATVADLQKKHNVFCLILGLETKTKISKFIYGTTGTDIAGQIKCPIIIVPQLYKHHKINTAVIAVDNPKSISASITKKCNPIKTAFKCHFKYVHVRTPEEILPGKKTSTSKINIEQIESEDFASGLTTFDKQNNIDLNIIISHRHSPVYRFFVETNTKTIAFQSKIPVLVIHG